MKKAVVFLFILSILTAGCSIKKVQELSDAEKFAKEFNISSENPFVYTSIDNILNLLENGTGIIFFANSDYEGSVKAATYITQVAKKENVQNIYYYNPKKLMEKDSKKYRKLIKQLKECIKKDQIKLPDIYVVKDGKILNHATSFAEEKELSEEYLSKKQIKKIKDRYKSILTYEECSDCC